MGGDARHRFAFSRHRPSGTSDVPASLNQRGRSVVAGRTSTTLIERAAACIVAGGIDIKALPEGARQRHCAQRVTVPDGGSCTIACPARPPQGLVPRSLESWCQARIPRSPVACDTSLVKKTWLLDLILSSAVAEGATRSIVKPRTPRWRAVRVVGCDSEPRSLESLWTSPRTGCHLLHCSGVSRQSWANAIPEQC